MSEKGCPIQQQAEVNPGAVAVMAGDLFWSYHELNNRITRMASDLLDLGLKQGDVLLAAGANSPMLVVLIFACLRAGIIIVPVNPAFPRARLRGIAEEIGARAFWSESGEPYSEWQGDIRLPTNLAHIQLGHIQGELTAFHWDEQRICNLVMTSGSSGFPKAAAFNFSCHRASARASAGIISLEPNDGWLLSLPLYHIGGLAILFRCVLAGAQVVFPDHRRQLTQTLVRRKVTHLSLVNTQLYRLLETVEFSFQETSVKTLLVGGGYVSADVAERCRKQGVRLLTTYGMTETSSQVCTGEPLFLEVGALTSGQPLGNVEIKLTEDGEITFRGPSLFKGYWSKGALRLPLTEGGWFLTGDRGHWVDGHLQVAGRCDSQFISGGENIQPETIERALLGREEIYRAVVVPLFCQEFGQRPVAFIDCKKEDFYPLLWSRHLRDLLPGFMVPDHFLPWPCEQKESGLKVSRVTMAETAGQILSCLNTGHQGRE
ncbi:AMP-binding protein [Sansalvadorimonas sp. 2012CJ34-2]|uniref:AMP-binding protein n=1 Tax=Parendozoicomonas callyspongiae TaxID=2942213 RepID=A0ABT0PDQ1_9GAMM|nr:AMP-binding protein [Sansalvadorimonas sp. 2012CJ34-2]MCL6269438.1 AMP-binding protein [Sansalvadorimonas sp. 2012CJ34-2]